MKVDIKGKVVEAFEDLLDEVKGLSWVSLSSFLFGAIVILAMEDAYREAVLAGLIFVGASLLILKLFIAK